MPIYAILASLLLAHSGFSSEPFIGQIIPGSSCVTGANTGESALDSVDMPIFRDAGSQVDYPPSNLSDGEYVPQPGNDPDPEIANTPLRIQLFESPDLVLGRNPDDLEPEEQVGRVQADEADDAGGEDDPTGGPSRRQLNIFLEDTRSHVNEHVYPYRAVCKFRGCTATLVKSSGIVVTNAHCLPFTSGGSLSSSVWSTYVYCGYRHGTYLRRSRPKAIHYNPSNDYAVFKLWTNIDSTLGRYGARWRSNSYFWTRRYMYMNAYSGDHCPNSNTCHLKRSYGRSRGVTVSGSVRHDLDCTRGSSGSAMYRFENGLPVMNALNFGEDRDGGEESLTLNGFKLSNSNFAKSGGVWKYGWDQVKNY